MSDLVITGVIDGPLSGGFPKAIELTALADIADLSIYAIGSANNGQGTDGPEFMLSGSAKAGEKIYIASESIGFISFFGFAPNFIDSAASVNGDDAIELFMNGDVVDVFGDINTDGSGQPWEYLDGWAVRKPLEFEAGNEPPGFNPLIPFQPGGTTFDLAEWLFSSPNALDGESSNIEAATPFPVAAIYIEESDGNTIFADGTTDTYTVVLATQPLDTVVVTITPDAGTQLNGLAAGTPILLTFTPDNFDQPQTVTVNALESSAARKIEHSATSNDPGYDSSVNGGLILNITDPANLTEGTIVPQAFPEGVTIVESNGGTAVSESGTVIDSYAIVLNTTPTDIVTVTVTPDIQTDLGNGAGVALVLTFDPADPGFSLSQTVPVTAVDDSLEEGPHSSIITHNFVSNDPSYSSADGLVVPDLTVTVLETGITITPLTTNPIEEGGTTTYTIQLNSTPTDPVTVTIDPDSESSVSSGGTTGAVGDPIVIVFDPAGPLSQEVTVTVDRDTTIEGEHSSIITHSALSADAAYNNITIGDTIANIIDSDVIITGVTTDPVPEGQQTTYDISLNTTPTAPVTVTVSPSAQTDVGNGPGNPIALIFNPGDLSLTQTVTVTAVQDGLFEGNHLATINHTSSSTDTAYDGLIIDSINFTLTDPSISITPATIDPVPEGGTTTYDVVLSTIPNDTVTVTLTPTDAQTDLGLGAGVAVDLIFDPAALDFSLTQTVTVTAFSDSLVEGNHSGSILHSSSSPGDTAFDGLTIDPISINITDPTISLAEVPTTPVAEGGQTTYNVVLSTVPANIVTVTVTPDAQTDLGLGAGVAITLTFDPNAIGFDPSTDLQQTVAVTAVTDAAVEGNHTGVITHASSSADPAFNGITIGDVNLPITDPGISIVQTNGNTAVSELGITDQYDVVLGSVPTGNVTVTVDPDDQTDLGAGAGNPIDLLFDPGTLRQTVTVTAVDDGIEEGNHTSTITHSVSASTAVEYPTGALPAETTVTATIIDCFLTGTRLLTDTGERLVEELQIGDRLQTFDGTLETIKWVGIQTCYTNGHNHPLRTYPICIKAGALGENCPIRDLYVSPDHALLVDGILVNAGALENGDSIVQIQPQEESFVYYHIELERHNLVMAEGAPAESYLPQKQDRSTFDNGDEYAELYPHSNMQALLPMSYPRVSSKRQLPRFIEKKLQQIGRKYVTA